MVEPYESRRQKKPTGAVKAMPGKNPGPMRPNAAVTPYLGGNTFPLPFSGSVGTPSNYYGMTGRTHPTALGIYPADVATQSAVRTLESSTRVPDKRFPGRWNVPARPGPGGAMPLSAQSEPYTKATTSSPTMLPYQIQTPRPSFLQPTSPWNYVQSPVARPAPQSPSPASVPIDLTSYRPGMASAAPPQPWQVPAPSARTPQSPVQAAAPRPAVYPMYPGSSEWDTAPGWLARAGGVNTSTPEGRMFSAMNRPSVPVAKPAAPTGPSPWDIGTAAMNLGSPEMVKPYESAADRHAQAAAQVRRMPPGGYLAAQLAALAGNLSTGPNISIPGGADAVARAEAKRRDAATLAQSFDRLRERSKAVPFGTYLAGTPETIGNLTEGRPWIDPAKTVTETMTWDEYLMKNRAQMAAMQQGRPFDLVPAWIGPSGRQRPPSTWELAKNKKSTRGDGSKVAEAIRSRAAERKLKEEPRRAMVTAKAQGRRISPVQAGIEAAMTSGRDLTEDQNRAIYGPMLDEIKARQQAAAMAAISGILTPGEGMPQDPNVSRWAMQVLPGFMQGMQPWQIPAAQVTPVQVAEARKTATSPKELSETLQGQGVDRKTADSIAAEEFRDQPSWIGSRLEEIVESENPWIKYNPLTMAGEVLGGMAARVTAPSGKVVGPSIAALKSLQDKARAGNIEAQRILSEGGYSW